MVKVLRSAIVAQIALGAYLQVVEWIPLWRWNNVSSGNGKKSTDIILVLLQATILVFYGRRWRWPMFAGLGLYGFWFHVQVSSWWVPYFRSASSQFMRFYQHWFGNTYKFPPRIDGHPIPDAEHTVILGLLLLV
jgi:hypothetical protein